MVLPTADAFVLPIAWLGMPEALSFEAVGDFRGLRGWLRGRRAFAPKALPRRAIFFFGTALDLNSSPSAGSKVINGSVFYIAHAR